MSPIPTVIEGWNKGSIGIWAGLAMFIVYGLPKFITAMRKLGNDRGDNLDEERREDMKAMRAEIADIKRQLTEAQRVATQAEDRAREAENRLSTAVAVIRMLSAKVRKEWPDDPILTGIGELIDAATAPDAVMIRGYRKLPEAMTKRHEGEAE